MRGEEIRKKREELKLTQEELAEILGISVRTLISYEKGGVIPNSKNAILQNFIDGKIEGSNINVGNNYGNIAGKNLIQISLPEEGTQKIIKPDGTVIVESITSKESGSQCSNEGSTNKELLDKIYMQNKLIESLENTIKAQQQSIDLLSKQIK